MDMFIRHNTSATINPVGLGGSGRERILATTSISIFLRASRIGYWIEFVYFSANGWGVKALGEFWRVDCICKVVNDGMDKLSIVEGLACAFVCVIDHLLGGM